MLTFFLFVTLVLQPEPIKGCILGFKYVPPADSKSTDTSSSSSSSSSSSLISTRQSCVQCRRSLEDQHGDISVFSRAFSAGKPSPRFLYPPSSATTAATTRAPTTTTTAPCCTGELKNSTGMTCQFYLRINNKFS